MLGRLKMNVDQCIDAYQEIVQRISTEKDSPWVFDLPKLGNALRDVLRSYGQSDTALLNDGREHGSKV